MRPIADLSLQWDYSREIDPVLIQWTRAHYAAKVPQTSERPIAS